MKIQLNKVVVTSLCIILGFFMAIQIKNVQEDYSFVSLRTITDLQNLVKKETEELSNISELLASSKNRLAEYEEVVSQGGSIRDILKKEHDQFKMISGFVDLQGPGVIVRLSDSDRELYEWEDPNNVIVHDLDVLILVNDLKIAGAEAISINGQRIMSTSEIQCAGATITINNYTYGQPFIIRAIGDPDTLNAAMKSPESYATLLKDVYSLGLEVATYENIKVPRFNNDISWRYLTPKEGE